MKEYWKMLRRGLAMVLAVVMLLTSSNLGIVLRAAATGADDPTGESVKLTDIVLELYKDKLSANLKEIIASGELKVQQTYTYTQPTEEDDLIEVDEVNKKITAEIYSDIENDLNWKPVAYRLVDNDSNVLEEGVITEWPFGLAEVTYAYEGNAFTVEVDYEATVSLDTLKQNQMLSSGALLAEDIATLLLLEAALFPEKPEGWNECKDDAERVEKFGQEVVDKFAQYDALQAFIDAAKEQVPQLAGKELKLTPKMVLMLMTMDMLEYDEKTVSAIDLLGILGKGITTELPDIPEELEYIADESEVIKYNRKTGKFEATLKIPGTDENNAALESLAGQENAMLLDKFLTGNSDSYLEWLMVTYDALDKAVEGNYEDLYQLAKDGLPGVIVDMNFLLSDIAKFEDAAMDLIKTTAADYGLVIEDRDDLDELLAGGFDGLIASYAANVKVQDGKTLNDLIGEMNEMIADYPVASFKNEIKSEQDLKDLETYLEDMKDTLENIQSTAYDKLPAGYESLKTVAAVEAAVKNLNKVDIPGLEAEIAKIKAEAKALVESKYADMITDANSITAAINALKSDKSGEQVQIALTALNAALAAAKAKLPDGWDAVIESSADIENIIKNGGLLDQEVNKADAAYQAKLKELNAYIDTVKNQLPEGDAFAIPDDVYDGKIDDYAEFEKFYNWMIGAVADAEAGYADTLAEIDNAVETVNNTLGEKTINVGELTVTLDLTGLQYTGEALSDPDSDDTDVDVAEKLAAIEAWMNGLPGELEAKFKALITEKIDDPYTEAQGLAQEALDIAADYGYTGYDGGEITSATVYAAANSEELATALANAELAYETAKDLPFVTEEQLATLKAAHDDIKNAIKKLTELADGMAALEEAKGIAESAKEDAVSEADNQLDNNADLLDKAVNTLPQLKKFLDKDESIVNKLGTEKTELEALLDAYNDWVADAADCKTALAAEKSKVEAAEENLKNAETAGLPADVQATVTKLEAKQAQWRAKDAEIAAKNEIVAKLEACKSDIKNAEEIGKVLPELDTYLNLLDGKLEMAQEAYAELETIPSYLDTLDSTDAELDTNISMLNNLITMLELFCETIKPIYDNCVGTWNARDILKAAAADYDLNAENQIYDVLTALVYTSEGFQDVSHTVTPATKYTLPTATIEYRMSMFDVDVVAKLQVLDDKNEPVVLDATAESSKTLLAGVVSDEVLGVVGSLFLDNADVKNMTAEVWNEELEDEEFGFAYENYVAEYAVLDKDDNVIASGDNVADVIAKALPEGLNKDITVVITYVPREYDVTLTDENGQVSVTAYPYSYKLALAANADAEKEYTYTVNGKDGFDQGDIVTILGDTQIVRAIGAASVDKSLYEVVVSTTANINKTIQAILESDALYQSKTISIRIPGDDLVKVDVVGGDVVITAKNYDAKMSGKEWQALTVELDGNPAVDMTAGEGVYTYTGGFDEGFVNYTLKITADELAAKGVTAEEMLAAMNLPYVLSSNYAAQKAVLDYLSSDEIMGYLTKLNAEDVIDSPLGQLTLKDLLGKVDAANETGLINLGAEAVAAAKSLYQIIPDEGYISLYNTLEQYRDQGMVHFYKNPGAYNDQIDELNGILVALVKDPGFADIIAMAGSYKTLLNEIQSALADAANMPGVDGRINVNSGNDLTVLLANLQTVAEQGLATYYDALGDLTWVEQKEVTGVGKYEVKMNVSVNGKTASETKRLDIGNVMTADELEAWANEMVANVAISMMLDADWMDYAVSTGVQDGGNDNYSLSWNWQKYNPTLEIGGENVVVGTDLTMDNTTITLPEHSDPENFRWDFTIDGKPRKAGDVELTKAQFKDLVNGNLNFTYKLVDLEQERLEQEEEEKRKEEQKLINRIGGFGVMSKIADGQYAVVLPINLGDPTESLMGFVMGMLIGDYKTIELGDDTLYAENQVHLQTLVDTIMNCGLTKGQLLSKMDGNGSFKNDFVLPGTYIETEPYGDLGSQMVKSTMTFIDPNGELATVEVDFYITLAGNAGPVASALESVPVDFKLDGGAYVTADLPGYIYTAYLAALSMVGEVDLANMQDVDSEVVIGYMFDLLEPVLGDETVTLDTIENTLAELGVSMELSAYESYFQLVKRGYNLQQNFTEDGFNMVFVDVDINSVVHSLQGTVDEMLKTMPGVSELLPNGIDLSAMIYEYNDPADDEDEYGLDFTVGVGVNNISEKYDVMFIDVKAGGLDNKFGMTNLDENGKLDLQTTSVVVLLRDIEGDLYIPDTMTLVDLNGYDVKGTITGGASADVIVIDSNYEAEQGTVGAVSGNVTVLGGTYLTDVSAYLNDGYKQETDGTVGNKLFTVTETDDVITFTLNTTVADAKTLLTEEGVFGLAAEILVNQLINHYNVAGVSMDGNTIYNISIEDVLGVVTGGTDEIVDTALAFIDASELSEVFNLLVDDLTDYAGIAEALAKDGDGVIASHKFTNYTWGLELVHKTENDSLTFNFGGKYGVAEEKTLQLAFVGEARQPMATLAAALAPVLNVDVELKLEDIYRNDAGQFNLKGEFIGSVVFDFGVDEYAVMMAVILAENADADLRADLIEAIENYYETGDQYMLRKVFNAMTFEDIFNSWDEHTGSDSFIKIVDSLGLTCADEIKKAVDNSEMGFDLLIDGVAAGLRLLNNYGIGESVTDSGRTLGSLERTDANGRKYYGFTGGFEKSGSNRLIDFSADVETVAFMIYVFRDHVHKFEEIVADEYLKTAATCTEAAVYYKSCSVCGVVSDETFTSGEALGHDLFCDENCEELENYLAAEATCTTRAKYYKHCHVCDYVSDETFEDGTALGHKIVEVVEDKYLKSAATCTEAAVYYKSCERCGEAITAYTFTYGDPADHKLVEKVADEYLKSAATCTELAVYYKSCSVCGEASDETFTYGKPAGHKLVEVAEEKYLKTAATCTDAAVYYKSCSVCGEASTETFTYGEALGHKWIKIADDKYLKAEATCDSPAEYYYACEVCGESSKDITGDYYTHCDAEEHVFNRKLIHEDYLRTEATCTEHATYFYSCSKCGAMGIEYFVDENSVLPGHNLVENPIEKYLKSAATCTEQAVYYKSCSVCGEASNDTFTYGTLAAHTLVELVDAKYLKSEATCTKLAVYYKSCSVCGEASTETFEAGELKAHVYDQKVATSEYLASEATCTKAATYYFSCVCGAKGTETFEVGEALGHGETKLVGYKAPTTTEEGYSGDLICLVCNEVAEYGHVLAKLPVIDITHAEGEKVYGDLVEVHDGETYLLIDTLHEGMTKDEVLAALGVSMTGDHDGKFELVEFNLVNTEGKDKVGTGSTVTLKAVNKDGAFDVVTVTIIIMGDTNCDGRLSSGDAVLMHNFALHREATELSFAQKLAGNVNRIANENFSREGIDSGDAVIVMNKWLNRYVDGKLGAYISPLVK